LRGKKPVLLVEPLVFSVFFQKPGLLFQAVKLKCSTRNLALENLVLKITTSYCYYYGGIKECPKPLSACNGGRWDFPF